MVMLIVVLANVGQEIIVFDVDRTTFIQQIEDALIQRLQQLDDLDVVSEVQTRNHTFESLLLQHVLFMHEHLFQIDLMYLLVGVVHAELLETVVVEDLKAIDI